MKGQWIGKYSGSNNGTIVANIDELPSSYKGVVYINDDSRELPSVAAFFETRDKSSPFEFRTYRILPIDPRTGITGEWDNRHDDCIKKFYKPGIVISQYADVQGSVEGLIMELSWIADNGLNGSCKLQRSMADRPSDLVPIEEVKTWGDFKIYVSSLKSYQFLFRGQNQCWRLRTTFHRSGRADLYRFRIEDIQLLRQHLSARTKHVFNLSNPDENGAFFNLLQHHGYPTPLLDWSYSPYVAAFFAYRGIKASEASSSNASSSIRILAFDQTAWKQNYPQIMMLDTSLPHFSIGDFIAIENERMIPQQAASTITNIDDVETYIRNCETEHVKYLRAIDLPVNERRLVFRELAAMGITAGSLFPGLDGACEELRERNFEF